MTQLKGKTAVVTGGSRGLGRGVVEALVAQGMRVVAIARDRDTLAKLRQAVKGEVETVAGDVTDAVLAAQVVSRERPHALVLNAGVSGVTRPTRLQTWETFSRAFDVDVRAAFLWTREALVAPLEKGSSLIIVSSAGALRASPASAGYGAAKAAVWSFARSVAPEAKELGIQLHALLPSLTPGTDMGRQALAALSRAMGVSPEEFLERRGMTPVLTPALMGQQVVALLTDPRHRETVSYRATGAGLQPIPEAA